MRIKNTAFIYNVTVNGSSNCDWGTDIGQGKKHTFTLDGFPEFVNAMVYYKIEDVDNIKVILGKGNRTPQPFSAYSNNKLVLASCFKKVFVNGQILAGQQFIAYILKETNEFDSNGQINGHKDRCTLKFSNSLLYRGEDVNQKCIDAISDAFKQTHDGSWAILEMNIENEDELHLRGFALGNAQKNYTSVDERNSDFERRLNGTKLQNWDLLFKTKWGTKQGYPAFLDFLIQEIDLNNSIERFAKYPGLISLSQDFFFLGKSKIGNAKSHAVRSDKIGTTEWRYNNVDYVIWLEQGDDSLKGCSDAVNRVLINEYYINYYYEGAHMVYELYRSKHHNEAVKPVADHANLLTQGYSYISAIKTKPFLILGGFSGTGKSQKVKELAFATCPCDGVLNVSETSPGNYLLVSVKPNWHDATDITGFRSSVNKNYYVTDFMRFLVKAKLYEEKRVPFFVCLDEMNLAPVEEYFADFLSVIESRKRRDDGKIVTDAIVSASVFNDSDYAADFNIFMKLGLELTNPEWKADEVNALSDEELSQAFVRQDIVDELKRDGLTIPSNVIIIGTVNMDDTTNSFSRKVIDRAMTFETVVGTFDDDYFKNDVSLNYVRNPRMGELFLSDEVRATEMIDDGRFVLTADEKARIIAYINNINEDLEGSPFKISYRILNETILLYRAKKRIAEIMESDGGFEEGVVFDTDLNTIFDEILMQKVLPRIEGDYEKCDKCLTKLSTRAEDNDWKKSSEKIEFMIKRFGTDKSGFTTFWN